MPYSWGRRGGWSLEDTTVKSSVYRRGGLHALPRTFGLIEKGSQEPTIQSLTRYGSSGGWGLIRLADKPHPYMIWLKANRNIGWDFVWALEAFWPSMRLSKRCYP
jgi:hypothetical protein